MIYGESYWEHNGKHVLRTQLERANLEAAAKDREIAELRRLLAEARQDQMGQGGLKG